LGSEVHLVITGERPLPRNAAFAGDLVLHGLRESGVFVHTQSGVERVTAGPGGTELTLKDGETVVVDEFLVATGRRAATAGVGLADARPGSADRVVDIDIAVAGSSLHADGYTGKARIVVDTERNVLLGVTFVGQDVAELLHSATVAIVGEVPLDRLWHAVPSFPTISEVWLRLLEAYGL